MTDAINGRVVCYADERFPIHIMIPGRGTWCIKPKDAEALIDALRGALRMYELQTKHAMGDDAP